MSSPSMLYAETAGVFFFLAASIINAYTLSKIKDVHENLFMGQFVIIAAFASLSWMNVSSVIELNSNGTSESLHIGKWVNTFLSGLVAIIAAYSCTISKELKDKVASWQYEFFYWSNIFIAVFAGMRAVIPSAAAGGKYVYKKYNKTSEKATAQFGMHKYAGRRRGTRQTRRRRN